jgi:hypothetical protein
MNPLHANAEPMKRTPVVLAQGILQIFVSLGALVSGTLLMIAPSGAMLHMRPDMLRESPFHDFFLPGAILFLVHGLGQCVAGVFTMRRLPAAGFLGTALGIALMIWIFVQVNMIGGGHFLQYSYFALGVLETALAWLIERSTARANGSSTADKCE